MSSVDPQCWNEGDGDCPECGGYALFHSHPSFPGRIFVTCDDGPTGTTCGEFEVDQDWERIDAPPAGFVVYVTPNAIGCFGMEEVRLDDDEPF